MVERRLKEVAFKDESQQELGCPSKQRNGHDKRHQMRVREGARGLEE